ncbi:hypothetical protein MTO96_037466 [Rhipicephalus appendiculatus]
MDPSHKHCDCQFCPECQDSIPEDLQQWLQQQLDPQELDEPKGESEEVEEPGCPDAALLVTKASASADQMVASATEYRPGGSGSRGCADSSPKMGTPDIFFGPETLNSFLRRTNPIPQWLLRKAHPHALDLMETRL